jgi:type VI secretion system protein ImpH
MNNSYMPDKNENIDYLAELVASHLLANKKTDDSMLFIHFLGVFKRFFSKDIEKIDVHKNGAGEEEWNIFLHREGLYDLLPEGFFHGGSQKYFKDRKDTIEEFRRHKEEEKNSRLFFMPLEQEFFKHLVHKEIFEQNFFYAPETIHEFIDFFNLSHLALNTYQKAALFFILPHISKIAGNLKLTETCFEIILQERVRINTLLHSSISTIHNGVPVLRENMLGVNSILGSYCIDHNPRVVIELGPLNNSSTLINYINGNNRDIINRLIEIFMQADLITDVEVLLNQDDEMFVLGGKDFKSRLSYSTTI